MFNDYDIRIDNTFALTTPSEISKLYPLTEEMQERIRGYRKTVSDILSGKDNRLIAVVGPCSIHDQEAAFEYAQMLKKLSDEISDTFFVIMRTYFEKPRTNIGWKGLIMDPDMNESYNIQKGLITARSLLLRITDLGLPVGCEVLDPIIPQYIDEIMSWSSIGARTTESQTHRNLASGLSVAVGFKNSTSGDVSSAINAIKSANSPSSFIGISKDGKSSVFRTKGNKEAHLILRGGTSGPNYYEDEVEEAAKQLKQSNLLDAIIIDCSHGNSKKDYRKQKRVLRQVVEEVIYGHSSIKGFMLESNIFEGRQDITENISNLKYGVSVTDACISFEETDRILKSSRMMLKNREKFIF